MTISEHLRAKAANCRRIAEEVDDQTRANLLMLAEAFEAEADALDSPESGP